LAVFSARVTRIGDGNNLTRVLYLPHENLEQDRKIAEQIVPGDEFLSLT
jgi:hypothetical protein